MSTINKQVTTGGPDIDDVYEVLASYERRAILDDIVSMGGKSPVACLIDRFGDREHADGLDEHRYHIRLRHNHLPKMSQTGVVEYDDDTDHVVLTEVGYLANDIQNRAAELVREH